MKSVENTAAICDVAQSRVLFDAKSLTSHYRLSVQTTIHGVNPFKYAYMLRLAKTDRH